MTIIDSFYLIGKDRLWP